VVDTLGQVLVVAVHAADIQGREGAKLALAKLAGRLPRLAVIWADAGYTGKLLVWALVTGGWMDPNHQPHYHTDVGAGHRWVDD